MVILSHVIRLLSLLLFVSTAHAESKPASVGWQFIGDASVVYSSADLACSGGIAKNFPTHVYNSRSGSACYSTAPGAYGPANWGSVGQTGLACESGWTLEGSNCTRPDCVAPQVRNATTGVCEAPPDPCASRTGSSTGWYSSAVGAPSLESSQYCDNGCTVGMNASPTGSSYTNGKLRIQQYTKVQLSYACTNGLASAPSAVPANTTPPEPPKTPPCAATEGVLTSSSGTIACVPPGTPASAPPIVDKKRTVDSFPDGSQKITDTTTTRDPQTGVEDKRSTTTNTPAAGGSAGQAGTPGTSTSASTGGTAPNASSGTGKEGDTSSGFCQKNPNLQICKGDMNKEETQKKVEEHLKAIKEGMDPGTTSYDAVKNAKQTDDVDQQLTEQNEKLTAATSGVFSPNSTQRGAWESAMESGWFEPITRAGCSPYTATIGERTWTLDICPTAEKISVISEYAIWFALVVGVFVMFTGGTSRNA